MQNIVFYQKYSDEQLTAMGKVYYSGKANDFQKQKYEFIQDGLLEELRQLNPKAGKATAVYLQLAIGAALRERHDQEKKELARMRANAQNAHNNLLNYDLEAKQKERGLTKRAADSAECVCENHTDNDGWRCNVCGLLSPHRR